MPKWVDTWISRIANWLQIIGFDFKKDTIIGAICALVVAAIRGIETMSLSQVLIASLATFAIVLVILAAWRVWPRKDGSDTAVTQGPSAKVLAIPR
ncbi:MAG: hypothetical protein HY525_06040 [Betaproteobacteria bacterium]|nr:hypothetical protein [Betaproteobacteria bacterium]